MYCYRKLKIHDLTMTESLVDTSASSSVLACLVNYSAILFTNFCSHLSAYTFANTLKVISLPTFCEAPSKYQIVGPMHSATIFAVSLGFA